MRETELIEEIAYVSGVPKVTVAKVIKSFKTVVKKTLGANENVVLTRFGSFFLAHLKKKPLFGEHGGKGTWAKVKFSQSRRKHHGEVRSSS